MQTNSEMKDTVSVIIPVYNCRDTLLKSVQSVQKQSYENLEIILVDDGSNDGSDIICDELASGDSRIIVVHKTNGGVSSARNAGLDCAKGEFITFLDADDLLHHKAIEYMYLESVRNGKKHVICKYEKKKNIKISDLFENNGIEVSLLKAKSYLTDILYGRENGFCWGKLWNKELLGNNRFVNISMCEDVAFIIDVLMESNNDIVFLDGQSLYYYIQRDDSVAHTLSHVHLLDSIKSAEYIQNKTKDIDDELKKAANCYIVNTAFFAYLNSKSNMEYRSVRTNAKNMIIKKRDIVLTDRQIMKKTLFAIVLSKISLPATEQIYHLFH